MAHETCPKELCKTRMRSKAAVLSGAAVRMNTIRRRCCQPTTHVGVSRAPSVGLFDAAKRKVVLHSTVRKSKATYATLHGDGLCGFHKATAAVRDGLVTHARRWKTTASRGRLCQSGHYRTRRRTPRPLVVELPSCLKRRRSRGGHLP